MMPTFTVLMVSCYAGGGGARKKDHEFTFLNNIGTLQTLSNMLIGASNLFQPFLLKSIHPNSGTTFLKPCFLGVLSVGVSTGIGLWLV